jgi:hypothetical protein
MPDDEEAVMSETGSSSLGKDSEIDDPGRDPKGIGGPPRNPLGGGPDQDSGRGEPKESPGTEGESMMPEAPDGDAERA